MVVGKHDANPSPSFSLRKDFGRGTSGSHQNPVIDHRCSTCSGRGNKTCATCKGQRRLVHFLQLAVMWYVAELSFGAQGGGRGSSRDLEGGRVPWERQRGVVDPNRL